MANIAVDTIPFLYTEAEAVPVDNILVVDDDLPRRQAVLDYRDFDARRIIVIRVTVGTVQFALNGVAVAANPGITVAMGEIHLSLLSGDTIHFKCATQADAFLIYG